MRLLRRFAFTLLLFASVTAAMAPLDKSLSGPQNRLGVVLMHGTRGTTLRGSPLAPLIAALQREKFLVAVPKMPWSRARYLGKTVEESLLEIDSSVEKLKARGATKIVVGGHSIGANAAMAYGARRKGLAGILAIAPGHVPGVMGWQKKMGHDYRRAEKLIKTGKAKKKTRFNLFVQGRKSTVVTTPEIYFSWFNPSGAANYPANARKLKPDTALFWIVGRKDIMARRGRQFAFSQAPDTPRSAYVVVAGKHKETPRIGAKQIIDWLRSL